MNDQDRISLESVVGEVMLERHRQDRKWGGAQHDDRHSVADFVRYIRNYSGWADQMADAMSLDKARRRLIQVAALAVAAVQAIDRRWDREGKSIERRQVTEYLDGEGVLIGRLRQLTGFEGEASIPKVLDELEKLQARASKTELHAVLSWADGVAGALGTEHADKVTDQEARISAAVLAANQSSDRAGSLRWLDEALNTGDGSYRP